MTVNRDSPSFFNGKVGDEKNIRRKKKVSFLFRLTLDAVGVGSERDVLAFDVHSR